MSEPMFQPAKYSPLSGLIPPAAGIELSERPYIGKVNVRGNPADAAFTASVEKCLGIALPLRPNTVSTGDACTAFWLGPDEWLIHCAEDAQAGTVASLRDALRQKHAAVTDVSDYYMVIRMSGDRAREVLAKGTPFDVHPAVFQAGACAQTCYGHASILLHCVDDAPIFDIQVRWSFAEYLWAYFVDGSREYS